MIENLVKFLQEKQKPGMWLIIADAFNVQGTPKQKSDYVRRLWKKVKKGQDIPLPAPSWTYSDMFLDKKNRPLTIRQDNNGIHIILGCIHVPFHNQILLEKVLRLIEDNKEIIRGFHIIGDFLDLRSLAKQNENSVIMADLTLGKEYKAGNKVLDLIDSKLPTGIEKTFLYGNHEARYFKHVSDIKNYKTADAIESPEQALKLKERGYKVYSNWEEDYFTIGKYQIFHGIYCSVNPSKSHVDKLRSSCIFAHTHRINQYFDNKLHGLNIGMLGDIDSETFHYVSRIVRSTWKNGFGIVNISGEHSQAEVIVCENNSFFFGGKKY